MKTYKKSIWSLITAAVILSSTLYIAGIVEADDPVTTVSVDPLHQNVDPGQTFFVDISCIPGVPIKSFELNVAFDAIYLSANSVSEGNIFSGYNTFFNDGSIDNDTGTIENVYNLIVGQGNVTNSGTFIRISFTAKQNMGISSIALFGVGVTDETNYLTISVTNGSVSIGSGNSPPPQPTVDVTPNNPNTNNDLTCTITDQPPDPDEDPITHTYQWYENSILMCGETSNTLSHAKTSKDNNYECRVTPNDGTTNGQYGSDDVTIGNSPPNAENDIYTTAEKQILTISGPGVLKNDTDSDEDILTAVLQDTVSHGSLVLNSDGSFVYTPDEDFIGVDSFTYVANDSIANSNVATVTINIVSSLPSIEITKPDKAIYLANKRMMNFHKVLIIGKIDIEVSASNGLQIDEIEFYINDEYMGNDTDAPYTYTWDKKIPFKFEHTIKIIAYYDIDKQISKELTVWKFF